MWYAEKKAFDGTFKPCSYPNYPDDKTVEQIVQNAFARMIKIPTSLLRDGIPFIVDLGNETHVVFTRRIDGKIYSIVGALNGQETVVYPSQTKQSACVKNLRYNRRHM